MRAFSSIDEAIEDYKKGKMLIVIDDENRENEGDLILAGEKVTSEAINFMAKYGRGLICVSITEERARELEPASLRPAEDRESGWDTVESKQTRHTRSETARRSPFRMGDHPCQLTTLPGV